MSSQDSARKAEIEHILRTDNTRYWRNEAIQQEYREILGREIAAAPAAGWSEASQEDAVKSNEMASEDSKNASNFTTAASGKPLESYAQVSDDEAFSSTPVTDHVRKESGSIFRPEREATFPTDDDVDAATKHDYAYAHPLAGFFKEGAGVVRTLPLTSALQAIEKNLRAKTKEEVEEINGEHTPTDKETSRLFLRSWLATRNIPIAALGYDPNHMVISPGGLSSPIAGLYMGHPADEVPPEPGKRPRWDTIWANSQYPTTPVHEAIHRGIRRLQIEGGLPFKMSVQEEEWVVRAFMHRYYGDAERDRGATSDRQIRESQITVAPEVLDFIEQKAAEFYQKTLKVDPKIRGPR